MNISQAWRYSVLMFFLVLVLANMGADGGCANGEDAEDVTQDRIVAQHWLYYNAKSDKTDVRATFRFGNELGTVLQLNPPAKVSFNETVLGFDPNWGWHHSEVAGVADNGTIVFLNNDGVEATIQTGVIGRISLPATLTFSRTLGSPLIWEGPALAAGEDVELFVASTANRINFVRFTVNALGATQVLLTPDQLSKLPPGAAVFTLKRNRNSRPDAKTKVTTSYESVDVTGQLL